MSLIPYLFDDHLLDQHFGHGMHPEDLWHSWGVLPHHAPRRAHVAPNYYRPWRHLQKAAARLDAGSKIVADKDKFQVCLDVQQFAPEEITVKTVGNQIVVEGKHEEKQDDHGYVSRHFVRKYALPEDHRAEDVVSSLSSDGVLSITAPKKQPAIKDGERVVPITATGPAHQHIAKPGQADGQKMEQ